MIFSTAMRILAIGAFATIAAFAADELPKEVPSDALDIEPPLLIKEGPAGRLPESANSPAPEVNVQALEMQLERAKNSAAGADRLYKIGALAKVEAEQRALKVVRLQSELERARLTQAKEETAKQQSRFKAGEISKTELEAAESSVVQALTTAQKASAKKDNAELEAAVLNLHRQEKLLAVGSGRKSAVNRAQDKVAALKRQKSEEAAAPHDD
jgi:3-methyladenine DNA glycosylase AlkC